MSTPGPIVLFGSGETSPSGRKIFEHVFRQLPPQPKIALLETPAGFEQNSARVIGRVAEFFQHRLENYQPQTFPIPARARGTLHSPDNAELLAPLLDADLIFMGPGSPTYAVRQLCDSLAWQYTIARHRLGAALAFASAAAIAASACALPVYEIYKVGEDLHWKDGLDFFGLYGLSLVFIPHWNNNDGGAELDTSRCFMGQNRFARLMKILPADHTVVGLDEKTALIIEPETGQCRVEGLGAVTLIHTAHSHTRPLPNYAENLAEIALQRNGHIHQRGSGEKFPLSELGHFKPYRPEASLPPQVWERALARVWQSEKEEAPRESEPTPPAEILALLDQRQAARAGRDWRASDALRDRLSALGWEVRDTPAGPVLYRISGFVAE